MPPTDADLVGTSNTAIPRPAVRHPRWDLVLVDRDGTLNVHRPGYVEHPQDLQVLPTAAAAIALFNQAPLPVVVVTNQQGVGKGVMSLDALADVHRALVNDLAPAHLDAFAVCPHLAGRCSCRKPLSGLFEQVLSRAPWAAAERCVMIGDADSDLVPALALGMTAVKVGSAGNVLDQSLTRRLLNCDLGRTEAATLR